MSLSSYPLRLCYFAMRIPEIKATASATRIYHLLNILNLKNISFITPQSFTNNNLNNNLNTNLNTNLNNNLNNLQKGEEIKNEYALEFLKDFPNLNLFTINSNDISELYSFLKNYYQINDYNNDYKNCNENNDYNYCNEKNKEITIYIFDSMITEEIYSSIIKNFLEEFKISKNRNIFILDTQDLRSIRNFRKNILQKITLKSLQNTLQNTLQNLNLPNIENEELLREISSIYRNDLSLIVSNNELFYLTEIYGINKEILSLVPFYYNLQNKEILKDFSERKFFVTIGNGIHPPNADSIIYMKEILWPKIVKKFNEIGINDVEYHIYGSYLEKYKHLTDKKLRFFIKGKLQDLSELTKYKINLNILRFGAGIKGKIADGWFYGLPTITTYIGYEGMNEENNLYENIKFNFLKEQIELKIEEENIRKLKWGGFVTFHEDQIIQDCISLYTNKELWKEKSEIGNFILKTKFSESCIGKDLFLEKLKQVIENKLNYKYNNYLQYVLQLNNYKSSYFMNKYINEKNRNKQLLEQLNHTQNNNFENDINITTNDNKNTNT
ncbi:hypothetical protein ABK040_002721 [Willaertia magna]